MSQDVAVVTGASGAIGSAIARMLSACGGPDLKIGLHYNQNKTAAEKLQQELPNSFLIQADLQMPDAPESILEQVLRQGTPFILVNNAGASEPHEPALLIQRSSFDSMMSINLATPLFLMQAFGKEMVRAESGVIINISSVLANENVIGSAIYRASKAALEAMTMQFAHELGPRGVRVNAVAPGFIKSAMTDNIPEVLKEKALKRTNGRLGSPAVVAEAVRYLIETDFTNGSIFIVDGGFRL